MRVAKTGVQINKDVIMMFGFDNKMIAGSLILVVAFVALMEMSVPEMGNSGGGPPAEILPGEDYAFIYIHEGETKSIPSLSVIVSMIDDELSVVGDEMMVVPIAHSPCRQEYFAPQSRGYIDESIDLSSVTEFWLIYKPSMINM